MIDRCPTLEERAVQVQRACPTYTLPAIKRILRADPAVAYYRNRLGKTHDRGAELREQTKALQSKLYYAQAQLKALEEMVNAPRY